MPARKRPNRKRKRRAVSLSSSSSSDDSSSDSDSAVVKRTLPVSTKADNSREEPESDSDSSSDSSSSSSDEEESHPSALIDPILPSEKQRSASPGPIPPSATRIPSFLPGKEAVDAKEADQALREKFTKFWMNNIVEGFKDELETIRKDPAFTTSKLSMLVDSLASGAEVFTSSHTRNEVNDMDIIMGE
ncbi:hypothetical protein BDP27DRAFT_1447810 [Rhodocollybia butyracea]|uniref:Ribosome assembly protein 3 n=1 Tax=Rhodocollybia butyracea TaxID=206335 RepID=A0A9P5PWC5_9AGAR|nr:hypothetical protein BDP27DRAFT_1447810 [Rhodocollybia butyracea]